MKSGIKIKQLDITDSGAACLASVCAYYGLQVPIMKIRIYAFTDQKGTNILGMVEAAQRLGLSAKGVKGPYDALTSIPLPAIALVVVKDVLRQGGDHAGLIEIGLGGVALKMHDDVCTVAEIRGRLAPACDDLALDAVVCPRRGELFGRALHRRIETAGKTAVRGNDDDWLGTACQSRTLERCSPNGYGLGYDHSLYCCNGGFSLYHHYTCHDVRRS